MSETGETTRERLLQAARELFTTVGYHAATTPLLAKRAGVAEGTIYRHFPSKKALFNAAYQEAQRWGVATVRAVTQVEHRSINERLGSLGRHWLEEAERDPSRVRLMLNRDIPVGVLDEVSRLAATELRQGIERLIALGKQEGVIRAGVVELWAAIWLNLVAFAADRVARHDWTASHPHTQATLEAAWEAIAWRPSTVGRPIPVGSGSEGE